MNKFKKLLVYFFTLMLVSFFALSALLVLLYRPTSDKWLSDSFKYFLYKSTDADENETINNVSNKLLSKVGKTDETTKENIKINLTTKALIISRYGMKNDSELFAEAFSYWATDRKEVNGVWNILDNFFTNALPQMKNENLHSKSTELRKQIINDIIEETSKKTKYNFSHLLPSPIFGFNHLKIGFSNNFYAKQSLEKTLLEVEPTISISENEISTIHRQYKNDLANLMIPYFKLEPKPVKNINNKFGVVNFGNHITYNMNIDIKTIIQNAMTQWPNHWDQITAFQFYLELFRLFNLIYSEMEIDLDYYFHSIEITNSLVSNAQGVTITYLWNNHNLYAEIKLKYNSFDQKMTKNNFEDMWWSSESRFGALFHEFGHVIEGFLYK